MAPTRWEELRKQFRWKYQSVALNFICPKCGGEIPEGNPGMCPHRDFDSPSVNYDPKLDGPIDGLPQLLRDVGYGALADQMTGKNKKAKK